jgi:hypothetical protein
MASAAKAPIARLMQVSLSAEREHALRHVATLVEGAGADLAAR